MTSLMDMRMKAAVVFFLALSSLLVVGCSSPPPDENDEPVVDIGQAPTDLNGGTVQGTRWRLVSMGEAGSEQAILVNKEQVAFIEFDKSYLRFAGSTGCNRFFGKYRFIDKAGFVVSQFGWTRIACHNPQAIQDRKIVKAIDEAHFFDVRNNKLTIAAADGQRLIFVPMAADVATRYLCDKGRQLSTSLSALTGHLTLQLPDGEIEDLTPESDASYANGLYRLQMIGEKIQVDDLTQRQRLMCGRSN